MEINFNLFFRSSLPKLSDLPNHLGKLITDGISINSSYSTDVEPPKPGQDLPTQIGKGPSINYVGRFYQFLTSPLSRQVYYIGKLM